MKARTLAVVAGALICGAAQATVIFSENFESFPVGNLAGNMTAGQTWMVDVGNEFQVSTTRSNGGGTKSVRVDSNTSSTYGWVNLPSVFNYGGPQNTIRASIDIWMDAGVAGATTYGLAVFGGATGATRIGGLRAYGSGTRIDVFDGTNWVIAPGATAPPGQWFNVMLSVTYTSTNVGTLQYFVNGSQVGSNQPITMGVHDFRLYQFATVFPLVAAGNYDNYLVETVPEPGTLLALAAGAAWLARRRRR